MVVRRLPRWVPVLLGVFLGLIAAFSPRAAQASEPGKCDERGASVVVTQIAVCTALAEAGIPVDDTPGFCDPRGASGVAPLPARLADGGTIEAAQGCDDAASEPRTSFQRRDGGDPPTAPGDVASSRVLGVTAAILRPAPLTDVLVYDELRQIALPRGVARGIDRPPRGSWVA